MLIFFGYIVIILDDIMLIKNANPQSLSLSYGIKVFPISFQRFFESNNVKAFIQIGSYFYVLIMASSILFYLTHNYNNQKLFLTIFTKINLRINICPIISRPSTIINLNTTKIRTI